MYCSPAIVLEVHTMEMLDLYGYLEMKQIKLFLYALAARYRVQALKIDFLVFCRLNKCISMKNKVVLPL